MAVNFSHRPVFPALMSEDSLVSPMRVTSGCFVEGLPEKNGDLFVGAWNSFGHDCLDYGKDRSGKGGSQESGSKDIIDLLPSDPFGMDISTTFTAITGWLEDLEVDYNGYGSKCLGAPNATDYELFAGLNFIWNKAMEIQNVPVNAGCCENHNLFGGFSACSKEKELGSSFCHNTSALVCNMEEFLRIENKNAALSQQCKEQFLEASFNLDGGTPHPALSFALGYLGVRDLLSVDMVCKSLHSTVRNDPLLWRSVHIDQPLNEKISDGVLFQLTSRAHGYLQSLSLVECQRITDDGLRHVLENNPRLLKLSVPGCTRLGIDGIVSSVKALKAIGTPGIKHLRIGGLFGVTQEHFEELKFLLGIDIRMQTNISKPHFYQRGKIYIPCDDDRAIDIEMCPKCQNLRLVYDCPSEDCQGKEHASMQICRGCRLCIARCVQCGRCINDGEYEETFCLELLCSGCSKQL